MKLRDIVSNIGRHIVYPSDFDYELNLSKALKNNRKSELSDTSFTIDRTLLLSNQDNALIELIHDTVFTLPPALIAFQCHIVAPFLSDAINKKFNVNSVVTCGYVIGNNKGLAKIFYEHVYFLRKRMEGSSNPRFPIHCWITLPNLLIIDPTILCSLLAIDSPLSNGMDYRQSYFISGKVQGPKAPFSYQPVFMGVDFINKLTIPAMSGM